MTGDAVTSRPGTEPSAGHSIRTPALLFCPGDRPERFAKAADADSVILDLEDAVAPAAKDQARTNVVEALADGRVDPARTMVRTNPAGTSAGAADVRALSTVPLTTVVLPKAERPDDLAALAPLRVLALVESARGVLAVERLAEVDNCVGLAWGGEDLTASVGGRSSRDSGGAYRPAVIHARTMVLLAAGAYGRLPVDGVYLTIQDADGLAAEAAEAAATGFTAKMAIHPAQVPVIRSAFAPTPDEVAWARGVLEAAAAGGVARYRGAMVDEPLLRQARAIEAAAGPGWQP